MKKYFQIKCPTCKSKNVVIPTSFLMFMYSVQPIECEDCNELFEINVITRLGLCVYLNLFFILVIFSDKLLTYSEKETLQMLTLFYIALLFVLPLFGIVLEHYKSWQYTLYQGSHAKRKIINYGCEFSLFVFALLVFYNLVRA